jgi:hypothetical protein
MGVLSAGVAVGFAIDPESNPAWAAVVAPAVLAVGCVVVAVLL